MQAGALAITVLAATAGGFAVLSDAFDDDGRDVGESPSPVALAVNGEIVFSAEGADGYIHLYAVQPDGSGRRQITDFGTNDTDPAVSPDGRTIAFVHQLEDVSPAIATIPIDGGTVTWQTEGLGGADPAWSPDGSTIAFVGQTSDRSVLYVMRVNGEPEPLTSQLDVQIADPTWSPDGTRIAFALRGSTGPWGLASIRPDGTGLEPLRSPDDDEESPAWSPDGSRIAFLRPGNGGHEVVTVDPEGGSPRLVARALEASLERDLAWAPDGSALLVSDGAWIFRVDAVPSGDPDANFVQLVKGSSAAWQPLPAGSPAPSPEPEPSPTPTPDPEIREIGLPFRLCHVARLGGVDFLGDGAQGIAWVGVRARGNGSCPQQVESEAVVAADFNGDEFADSWWGGIEYCLFCMPWDATDLDADGDEELIVLESSSSTPSFLVLTARRDPAGQPQLRPVAVAAPGHDVARLPAGELLRIVTGGDEGFSGWVRCEGFPAAPVLVVTWRDHPIEGATMEVHETKLVLREDGAAHITDTNDYTAPVGTPIPGVSDAPACGVDWQILG